MGKAGIFVSHSSQNNVLAHTVENRLKMLGYDPFVDFQGIAGGTQWETEIYDAMRRSVALVLCGTPDAVESKWVTAELILARYAGKPIVPLILEPCQLPDLLDPTQAIDCTRDPDAGYRKLEVALAHFQGKWTTAGNVVWPDDKSPYPGLFAFTEEYAPLFFGRERELEDTIDTLRQRGRPVKFLAVIGPSGSGKSSFVRAGLVPTLKAGVVLPGSDAWTYAPVFTPGATPFRNLAVSLRVAGENRRRTVDIEAALREKPTGLLDEVVDLLKASDARVVVVVDQFEELERQSPRHDAEAFVTAIRESVAPPESPLLVLATLRADFVAASLQFPGMSELLDQGNRMLGPIERNAMRRLIEEPARQTNLTFAPGIVDELLDETHHAEALAHLAFILRELWGKASARQPREVTRVIRDEVGSLSDVLARRAQAVLDESDPRDRESVIEQLTRLADVDDRGEFTRKRLPLTTIPEERRGALLRFVDAHLLVTSVDDKSNEQMITVAHEALFRSWPELRTRLSADSERIRLRRDLEHDSAEWHRAGQPASSLWRGERLAAALALIDADGIKTDDIRARFIAASKQADQQSLARESRMLATIAERELEVDPERAILLSLAAIDEYAWTADAERTLRLLLDESRCRGRLLHDGAVADLAFSPNGTWIVTASEDTTAKVWEAATGVLRHTLAGHKAPVSNALFDRDSRLIVTASYDRTARIWHVETGEEQIVLHGHEAWVRTAMLSPDGQSVITASEDKTARVWNSTTGAVRHVLRHQAAVTMAAFSRDGTWAVTASDDRTIRCWDAQTGAARFVLRGHMAAVRRVVVSVDETLVVSASQDGTARIWDVTNQAEKFVLRGHTAAVTHAVFSLDGEMVATASEDKTVRIWNVATGTERHVLRGHAAAVRIAAFTADGSSVVSASDDKTIRIWDVVTGIERRSLRGHEDRPTSLAFSSDGMSLASSSDDRSVRIWDLSSGAEGLVLRRNSDVATSALFSPDGTALVTSDADLARIWDARTGAERHVLRGHRAAVRTADFSPDGRWVVTASDDGTARIWGSGDGALHHVLSGHGDWVRFAAFSPDGTLVVTTSQDNTVRLWDVATGTQRHVMRGHDDYVRSAAFSPDGSLVITASEDNTARIWATASGTERSVLLGHEGPVRSPAFSPDGTLVVTASRDRTVRIWQVSSGTEHQVLRGHQSPVTTAQFSPDGRTVVSASDDRTVRIWDVETGTERLVLHGHEGALWMASINRDSSLVVTASADRTARIWELATGFERHVLRGHEGTVWSAVFSPDGLSVATASVDKTVRIWIFRPVDALLTLARGRVYRQLSPDERRRFGLPSTH